MSVSERHSQLEKGETVGEVATSYKNFRHNRFETKIQAIINKYSRPGLDGAVVNLVTEALTSSDEDESVSSHSPKKLLLQNQTKLKPVKLDYRFDGYRPYGTVAAAGITVKKSRSRPASSCLPVLTGYCTKLQRAAHLRRKRMKKLLNNSQFIQNSTRTTGPIILGHIATSASNVHTDVDQGLEYDNGGTVLDENYIKSNKEHQYEQNTLQKIQQATVIKKSGNMDSSEKMILQLNEKHTSKLHTGTSDPAEFHHFSADVDEVVQPIPNTPISVNLASNPPKSIDIIQSAPHTHGNCIADLKYLKNENELTKLDALGACEGGKSPNCLRKTAEHECGRNPVLPEQRTNVKKMFHVQRRIDITENIATNTRSVEIMVPPTPISKSRSCTDRNEDFSNSMTSGTEKPDAPIVIQNEQLTRNAGTLKQAGQDDFPLVKLKQLAGCNEQLKALASREMPSCDGTVVFKPGMSLKDIMKLPRLTKRVEILDEGHTSEEEIVHLIEPVSPEMSARTSKESELVGRSRSGRLLGSSKAFQLRKRLLFSPNEACKSSKLSASVGSSIRTSKKELIHSTNSFNKGDEPMKHSSSLATNRGNRTSRSAASFNEELSASNKEMDVPTEKLVSSSSPLSVVNRNGSEMREQAKAWEKNGLEMQEQAVALEIDGLEMQEQAEAFKKVGSRMQKRADSGGKPIMDSNLSACDESYSSLGASLIDIFKRPKTVRKIEEREESDSSEDEIALLDEASFLDSSVEISGDSSRFPSFAETIARLKSGRYRGSSKISNKKFNNVNSDSENKAPPGESATTCHGRGGSSEKKLQLLNASDKYSGSSAAYSSTSRTAKNALPDSYYDMRCGTSDSRDNRRTATVRGKKSPEIEFGDNVKKPRKNTGTGRDNPCLPVLVTETKKSDGPPMGREKTAKFGASSRSLSGPSAVYHPSKRILSSSCVNAISDFANDRLHATRSSGANGKMFSKSGHKVKNDGSLLVDGHMLSAPSSPAGDSATFLYYNASTNSKILTISESARKISTFS